MGILVYRLKLKNLQNYISKRNLIADKYDIELQNLPGLILPMRISEGIHSFYLYVVRHKKRDLIIQRLKDENIFVKRKPLSQNARRAGWQGFNYDLSKLSSGLIRRLK